jgi:molecular chaperone GrpE
MAKENKDNEELKNETKSQEEVKTSEACEEKNAAEASENAEQEIEVDPLEKAEAEIADLKKQLLYKIAEFDNYRKRTMAEKVELIMNGGEKTITAILPVMDDMERALEQMKKAEDVSAVVEGVELIQKKFMGILEKLGVKAIETEGAEFDVDLHEAIAQLPAPSEEMKNKIMDCTLKGYKLNDKVIRHSQVVVGM